MPTACGLEKPRGVQDKHPRPRIAYRQERARRRHILVVRKVT